MDTNSDGNSRLSSTGQLDFVSHWADQTVEQVILRGQQLREAKPHACPVREYDLVKIDFIKPPRSVRNYNNRRKKSFKSKGIKYSSRSSSPYHRKCRGNSPSRFHTTMNTDGSNSHRRTKKKLECSMRIAELSVPTKRQCIETWRNKYNILPDFMVERLRQHVLDQRPVVQVSDAIYCFKKEKACKRKRKSTESSDRTFESPPKQIKKTLRPLEIKTFCAIFGYKLSQKMIKPLEIILNSDLQKIADVVSSDISNLLRKGRKFDTKSTTNAIIHTDITKKITIWISDILEETSYKILADQLKDFEEQAGPALDLIDELVDSIVDICEPEPEVFQESSFSGSETISLGLEEQESEKVDLENALLETVSINYVEESIETHLRNKLYTIVDSIDKDIDAKSDTYEDSQDIENIPATEQIEFSDAKDGLEEIPVETINDDRDSLNENEEHEPNDEADFKPTEIVSGDAMDDGIENEKENLPDQPDVVVSEKLSESDDENNKKVTFSETVINEEMVAVSSSQDNLIQPEDEQVPWKASIENMEFAAANENLLSDADESWPGEMSQPILRPSESVSKSITSLGNIAEDEEKISLMPDEDKSTLDNDDRTEGEKLPTPPNEESSIFDKEGKIDSKTLESEKPAAIKTPSESGKTATDTLKDASIKKSAKAKSKDKALEKKAPKTPQKEKKTYERQSANKRIEEKDTRKPLRNNYSIDKSKEKEKAKETVKIMGKSKKSLTKEDYAIPSTTVKLIESDVAGPSQSSEDLAKHTDEKDAEVKSSTLNVKSKPDYRVYMKTAPSWVISHNSLYDASQGKQICKINVEGIRKWCRDLERAYENLKMWHEWIDDTSNGINMLHREMGALGCPVRSRYKAQEWIKLKRNIDKTAMFWNKLNKSTQGQLRMYKKSYQKTSKMQPTDYTSMYICNKYP